MGLNQQEIQQKKLLTLLEHLKKINNPNFTSITIHFKHAQQKSTEPYNYSMIKEIQKYGLSIIINGGIKTTTDFKEIIKNIALNNIAGVMIGRAAIQNPDALAKISNELCRTTLKNRSSKEIKQEFDALCKIHNPNQIYLETINKYCPWTKEE